jgi:hypothetical protein
MSFTTKRSFSEIIKKDSNGKSDGIFKSKKYNNHHTYPMRRQYGFVPTDFASQVQLMISRIEGSTGMRDKPCHNHWLKLTSILMRLVREIEIRYHFLDLYNIKPKLLRTFAIILICFQRESDNPKEKIRTNNQIYKFICSFPKNMKIIDRMIQLSNRMNKMNIHSTEKEQMICNQIKTAIDYTIDHTIDYAFNVIDFDIENKYSLENLIF